MTAEESAMSNNSVTPQAAQPTNPTSTPATAPSTPSPATLSTTDPSSTTASTTTTTPAPTIPSPGQHRPSSPILTARILTLVLQNGTALALHQPRPNSVTTLNTLRAALLTDPFFDPTHRTDELAQRTRPGWILFMDLVVLLAKLMRVLMRREDAMGEAEVKERIEVRNACLDQPFFQRWTGSSARPFSDDVAEDEGCEV